jgi:hypothetical protein
MGRTRQRRSAAAKQRTRIDRCPTCSETSELPQLYSYLLRNIRVLLVRVCQYNGVLVLHHADSLLACLLHCTMKSQDKHPLNPELNFQADSLTYE